MLPCQDPDHDKANSPKRSGKGMLSQTARAQKAATAVKRKFTSPTEAQVGGMLKLFCTQNHQGGQEEQYWTRHGALRLDSADCSRAAAVDPGERGG